MPIYEYSCGSCKKIIEKRQKFSDPPLTTCEACGGALERLISPPRFRFKGTGWYETDYGRKSNNGKNREPAAVGASATKSKPKSGPAKAESTPAKAD